MSLTASEVARLTSTIGGWENAEYGFTALVAISCFGEYIADFTEWWKRGKAWRWFGDIEHRKDNLAKFSTLVLIAALAAELLCVVRTNQLSGKLVGSLGDRSEEAFTKSGDALKNSDTAISQAASARQDSFVAAEKSTEATEAASSALDLAKGARQEADSFEKDIASSKEQLVLLSARYKLIQRGETEFLKAVDPFPGQHIEFQACRALLTDNETNSLSQAILEVLTKAKWETQSTLWQSCLNGIGVVVYANEGSSARTMSAANSLGKILEKLLRVDRKPQEFGAWEKLRDEKRFSPWNWASPVRSGDQPLAADTVRISVFGRFPQ